MFTSLPSFALLNCVLTHFNLSFAELATGVAGITLGQGRPFLNFFLAILYLLLNVS